MRVTEARIRVTQGFRLQSPPAGWPARGRGGEVITVPTAAAYAMQDAGHAEVIEIIRLDPMAAADPADLAKARENVEAANERCCALRDEMARLESRKRELKYSTLEDPKTAVQDELELLASERAFTAINIHRTTAFEKLRTRKKLYAALSAQTTLAEAEGIVSNELRGQMKRAAKDIGPTLAKLMSLYDSAARDAMASGIAALVKRANVTVTEVVVSELLAATGAARTARAVQAG